MGTQKSVEDQSSCQFSEADIDIQGIVDDVAASPPIPEMKLAKAPTYQRSSYLRQSLPVVLNFGSLVPPLLPNDLRDLWIRKTRILCNDLCLIVLPIKNKGYNVEVCQLRERKSLFGRRTKAKKTME